MRSIRTIGTAFTMAMVMAVTMAATSAPAYAAGGGNSKTVLCRNLARAIESLTAIYGADSELVLALQSEYAANCQ